MNKSRSILNVLLIATSLLACKQVHAASVCIFAGNSAALAFWLSNYQSNGQDDEIRLVSGTLNVPTGGFEFSSTEAHSLTISGGWNGSCSTTRGEAPTVIDGGGSQQLMRISSSLGSVMVRRITWTNGYSATSGAGAGGLFINIPDGSGNDVVVELNQFVSNAGSTSNAFASGGLYASTANGHLVVRNNLFHANTGGTGSAANLRLTLNGTAHVSNNTVASNGILGSDSHGGIYLRGAGGNPGAAFVVSNNILWVNAGFDLRIDDNALLYNNDIEDQQGVASPASGSNTSVSPEFVGGIFTSFRLKPNSPMVDAGLTSPPGGSTLADLDGNTRVQNGTIDIGAYEYSDRIFRSGFDSCISGFDWPLELTPAAPDGTAC